MDDFPSGFIPGGGMPPDDGNSNSDAKDDPVLIPDGDVYEAIRQFAFCFSVMLRNGEIENEAVQALLPDPALMTIAQSYIRDFLIPDAREKGDILYEEDIEEVLEYDWPSKLVSASLIRFGVPEKALPVHNIAETLGPEVFPGFLKFATEIHNALYEELVSRVKARNVLEIKALQIIYAARYAQCVGPCFTDERPVHDWLWDAVSRLQNDVIQAYHEDDCPHVH